MKKIEKQEISVTAGYMRHFGPLSGSDPKLERPVKRYLLTLFVFTNSGVMRLMLPPTDK